jgi:hypothetical protein
MVLEDPGAEAASPGVALPTMLALTPHTIKSCHKPTPLSPSRGPGAPFGAPPTPSTSIVNATTGCRWATGTDEVRLLSTRHHFLIQGKKQNKRDERKPTINTMCILGGHRQERPRADPLGQGLRTTDAQRGWPRHHRCNSPSGRRGRRNLQNPE